MAQNRKRVRSRWQPRSESRYGGCCRYLTDRSVGWSSLWPVSDGEHCFVSHRPSSTPARQHKPGNIPCPPHHKNRSAALLLRLLLIQALPNRLEECTRGAGFLQEVTPGPTKEFRVLAY